MSIGIKTAGVHHVALRSPDLERSKRFYSKTLGFQIILEAPDIFLFLAGSTAIGVRGPMAETAKSTAAAYALWNVRAD